MSKLVWFFRGWVSWRTHEDRRFSMETGAGAVARGPAHFHCSSSVLRTFVFQAKKYWSLIRKWFKPSSAISIFSPSLRRTNIPWFIRNHRETLLVLHCSRTNYIVQLPHLVAVSIPRHNREHSPGLDGWTDTRLAICLSVCLSLRAFL